MPLAMHVGSGSAPGAFISPVTVCRKGKKSSCSTELQGAQDPTSQFLIFYFCEALKVPPGPRTWEGSV